MLRKSLALFLTLVMLSTTCLTGCSGGGSDGGATSVDGGQASGSELQTIEAVISYDFNAEETTQKLLESDDVDLIEVTSPFYVPNTFVHVLENGTYLTDRNALIASILESADQAVSLSAELDTAMASYQSDLYGLFDSFAAEDEELPYVYEAANRYVNALLEESTLEAEIDNTQYDGFEDYMNSSIAYTYVLDAESLGLKMLDRLEWITIDGANLYMAAQLTDNDALMDVADIFMQSMEQADIDTADLTAQLANAVVGIHDGLMRLDEGDQLMTLAAMKFMQAQIPELRVAYDSIAPSESVTEEDLAAFGNLIDLMEAYAYGTEAIYLEESTYELALAPSEWESYINHPEMSWFDLMPVSYAASNDQTKAEMTAYKNKASSVMTSQSPPVASKPGMLSSIWNSVKSTGSWVADKASTLKKHVGYGLEYTAAARQELAVKAVGWYYGFDDKVIREVVDDNYKTVEDNFQKGISGSNVVQDAKGYVQSVEDLPGKILFNTVGKNVVTKALDNTSKFVTGCFTGFAKGIFTLADTKATNAQMAGAAFDVATSFAKVGEAATKVASYFGKPLVKLAASKTSSLAIGVKSALQSFSNTAGPYLSNALSKMPTLISSVEKQNLGKMVTSYSKYLYDGAKNVATSIGGYVSSKTAPLVASVKTKTQNAITYLKSTSVGKMIVDEAKTLATDIPKVIKNKLGGSFEGFIQNYVEGEGWNTVKEAGETLEAIWDSYVNGQEAQKMSKLVEAKKTGKLPSPKAIKTKGDADRSSLPPAVAEATRIDTKPQTPSQTQTPDNASSPVQTSGADSGGSTGGDTGQVGSEATDAGEAVEETEDQSPAPENPDAGASSEEADASTAPVDETSTGGMDSGDVEGMYTGYASEIVFYETDAGQMSFPIGAEHSQVRMRVAADGNVTFDMIVSGTEMFDFDVTITTSTPASYDGHTFTCVFNDFQGAATTVSGTMTSTSFGGTIGIYDEKNARIGHISIALSRN